ncbi:MAG TPA: malic enzyme-like NAD(P)-binding protein, partial [Vicinamibacterales bacterium]|nr:malic enzyme-like NAD(P)-binding protein [Vicinamibacterales bacterium]
GSPFGEYRYQNQLFRPGQGNNAYVFPGIGLGAVTSRARTIPDAFFLTAARTLAGLVGDADLRAGAVYPPLRDIRKVSLAIGAALAEQAYNGGLARRPRPADIVADIESYMYDPKR